MATAIQSGIGDVLTLKEAAAYLRVSRMTVIRWVKKKKETGIPGRKQGSVYMFSKAALERWVVGDLESSRAALTGENQ